MCLQEGISRWNQNQAAVSPAVFPIIPCTCAGDAFHSLNTNAGTVGETASLIFPFFETVFCSCGVSQPPQANNEPLTASPSVRFPGLMAVGRSSVPRSRSARPCGQTLTDSNRDCCWRRPRFDGCMAVRQMCHLADDARCLPTSICGSISKNLC